MSLVQGAHQETRPPAGARATLLAWPEFNKPAVWLVAVILLIMPFIANGFFLIEVFATTLILGTIALSLMFLPGYGGMVSLMQLTIAGFAAYMVAVFGMSANANISLGWPWWLATPMALVLATIFGTLGGVLQVWNYRQISPGSVGVGACIDILIIAVVGGITRPIGPFIGAFIFVILRTFALDLLVKFGLDGNRFRLLIGLGFLAIVFWSSDGVIGLWERWRRRAAATDTRPGGGLRHG